MLTAEPADVAQVERTPLQPLSALTEFVGTARLWIKRDDLFPFGGAKFRKAMAAARQARNSGAEIVVTEGSVESQHARALAIAARLAQLRCILVLSPERGNDAKPTLLDDAEGAEIVLVSDAGARAATVRRVVARLRRQGRRVTAVPFSGSTPMATLSYAWAFEELLEQAATQGCGTLRAIVLASATGGIQSGLELGKLRTGSHVQIVGVSPGLNPAAARRRIVRLVNSAGKLLGESHSLRSNVTVLTEYAGPGYLKSSAPSAAARELFARMENIELDQVYTAKAAAAFLDLARCATRGDAIVFWHSAG
ncbi:MAG: pyridoxal-phosphate dependent enzyme [Candidatus Eremiobacteraeota bacterium]|nr:pyridoxal-phosphate dependent enzyme [Candidatus Eremiobacteraeota bacterium]